MDRFCVLQLDDKTRGPLYLTINDEPAGFDHNSDAVTVSIFEALSSVPRCEGRVARAGR